MKNLVLASLLALCITSYALPANAMSKKALHKTFHYGVYIPVQVVAFIVAGPIIIASSAVQHFDDKLKIEAENEKTAE